MNAAVHEHISLTARVRNNWPGEGTRQLLSLQSFNAGTKELTTELTNELREGRTD